MAKIEKITTGNVMVYHDGIWGGFCYNTFTDIQGKTLCQQLGFQYYVKFSCCPNPRSNMEKIWITNAHCNGSEHLIRECSNIVYGINADNCGGGVLLSCTGIV